jgi:hypothetical protein
LSVSARLWWGDLSSPPLVALLRGSGDLSRRVEGGDHPTRGGPGFRGEISPRLGGPTTMGGVFSPLTPARERSPRLGSGGTAQVRPAGRPVSWLLSSGARRGRKSARQRPGRAGSAAGRPHNRSPAVAGGGARLNSAEPSGVGWHKLCGQVMHPLPVRAAAEWWRRTGESRSGGQRVDSSKRRTMTSRLGSVEAVPTGSRVVRCCGS